MNIDARARIIVACDGNNRVGQIADKQSMQRERQSHSRLQARRTVQGAASATVALPANIAQCDPNEAAITRSAVTPRARLPVDLSTDPHHRTVASHVQSSHDHRAATAIKQVLSISITDDAGFFCLGHFLSLEFGAILTRR
jgi:hypothetical protein